jgi:hypothetical protein
MDPIDLKTLAQFCIYGDPSVHPVQRESPTVAPRSIDAHDAQRYARVATRAKLRQSGELLQQNKATASKPSAARPAGQVERTLQSIARAVGLDAKAQFMSFDVSGGSALATRSLAPHARARSGAHGDRYHVMIAAQPGRRKSDLGGRIAIVARETGARVVGYRVYMQK